MTRLLLAEKPAEDGLLCYGAPSTAFWRKRSVEEPRQEPLTKWPSAAKEKPEISRYLPDSTKMGDFNPRRTLPELSFVIPERLASIRAIVLTFTANKQPR